MSEEKSQVNPVIKEIEEKYPEMTKEFKKIGNIAKPLAIY